MQRGHNLPLLHLKCVSDPLRGARVELGSQEGEGGSVREGGGVGALRAHRLRRTCGTSLARVLQLNNRVLLPNKPVEYSSVPHAAEQAPGLPLPP